MRWSVKLFILAFFVFALALIGMSVGVIFSDRRIRGSCGGLSHTGGKKGKIACDGCPSGGKNCSSDHDASAETDGLA